jgi:plastocyanin domain-containing protein
MNKNIFIATIIILLSALLAFAVFWVNKDSKDESVVEQNVEVRDGVQYVTLEAKGGYFPYVTKVEAGRSTKLIVKTRGTYDCSSVLVIRDFDIQKTLKPTGEEVFDLGVLKSGQEIEGSCGMGMYGFRIEAS